MKEMEGEGSLDLFIHNVQGTLTSDSKNFLYFLDIGEGKTLSNIPCLAN